VLKEVFWNKRFFQKSFKGNLGFTFSNIGIKLGSKSLQKESVYKPSSDYKRFIVGKSILIYFLSNKTIPI
jgi:hypothetical protein